MRCELWFVFFRQKDKARPRLIVDCDVYTVIMLWVTVVWENVAENSWMGALMCMEMVLKDDTQLSLMNSFTKSLGNFVDRIYGTRDHNNVNNANLILLNFITRTILGEEYRSWSFLLYVLYWLKTRRMCSKTHRNVLKTRKKRVTKKSLYIWSLQYTKLQVKFEVPPASLPTFIDTTDCVLYTTLSR
jgi:hypothetical protein